MNILYAVLGAGNGHVSRAREVIPHLEKHGTVDVAISGTDSQVDMNTPVKYRHHGIIFHLGSSGGIDYWKTFKDLRLPTFVRDIKSFPVEDYDIVVNDFEPITARSARRKNVPCVALSHQASFASDHTPVPDDFQKNDIIAKQIIRRYAPCDEKIGFHFERYDRFIRPPVIRSEVRQLIPLNQGHITVYLPAYDDQFLISLFTQIPEKQWELFSKRSKVSFELNNVKVTPINSENYTQSLGNCDGLLTGGGFEAPAEAMYLGKKLMVVPQKGQYEQRCNATAARNLGASMLLSIEENSVEELRNWSIYAYPVHIDFPDLTSEIVNEVVSYAQHSK